MFLKLEFPRQRDDLLDLTHVAMESPNALLGVQVPQPNGAIVGSGEDGAGSGVDSNCVDPVRVAAQETGRFVFEVPDLHRLVDGRRCKNGSIEVQANYAASVASVCGDALSGPPIPYLEASIHAAADQLGIVELEAADPRLMTI
jgi:hypothetical protein